MGIYIKEVIEVKPVFNSDGFFDYAHMLCIDRYGEKIRVDVHRSDIEASYVTALAQDPHDWRWYHSVLPRPVVKTLKGFLGLKEEDYIQ